MIPIPIFPWDVIGALGQRQQPQPPRKVKRIQPLTPDKLRERRRHIERVQYVARAQQKLKADKEASDQLDRDFAERNAQITAGVQMAISRMNAHMMTALFAPPEPKPLDPPGWLARLHRYFTNQRNV